MGMIPLESGDINVLGSKTKSDEIHEKGSRIGYMPQEMALIGELTVKETVYYFGNIFQMDIDKLRDRYEMIRKLLELPYDEQKVEECSGGQKRRVSFAAAMIHEPDLLILDEPTVGLDPLLREKIWKFMLDITRTSKLAIIITTHYIDEARQADCVGLMRNGLLLAEDPPVNILNRIGVDNLEEAFLQLCLKKGVSDEATEENVAAITENNNHVEQIEMRSNMTNGRENSHMTEASHEKKKPKQLRWQLIRALLVKNCLQLKRQPG
jgi:ABC-type multidrug transport system ATPase subunit